MANTTNTDGLITSLPICYNQVLPLVFDDSITYLQMQAKIVRKLNEVIDFTKINSIKYADPLMWDITEQYEANTVVVDKSGNAYLSVQPVPAGIALERTEYWTKIGNFDVLWDNVKKGITPYDEKTSTTASGSRKSGDLVWLDNVLYLVTRNMQAGDRYVTGSNCEVTSVSVRLNTIKDELNQAIDNLDNSLTAKVNAEAAARQEADTAIRSALTAESNTRAQEDTAIRDELNSEITNRTNEDAAIRKELADESSARIAGDKELEEKINNIAETYINVKKYGAKGDGSTVDSVAIARCVSENAGNCIYFPSGTYMINTPITIPDNTAFIGDGATSIIKATLDFSGTCMLQTRIWSPNTVNNEQYGYIQLSHLFFDGSYKKDYTSDVEVGSGTWDGLHIGGFGPVIDHVTVVNMPAYGVWLSDYRTSSQPRPRAETLVSNITVKWNGGHGLYVGNGSHDGEYVNCVVASNSRSSHNNYSNLVIAEHNANGRFTNCHFYSDYGNCKVAFSVNISKNGSPSRFVNCDIEGAANANLKTGGTTSIFISCSIYATFGNAQVYVDSPTMFIGCNFGGQANDPVPTDRPAYNQVINFRDISTEALPNVSFINCRLSDCNTPMVSYQPGGNNAKYWIFDLNGSSTKDPLVTTNIPPTWKVRWCGSFPTPLFTDTNA